MQNELIPDLQALSPWIERLRRDLPTVWLRPEAPPSATSLSVLEVEAAKARFRRFEPVLAALFPQGGWEGRIASPLIAADPRLAPDVAHLYLKADGELPMTGSVKARGGVHELLCWLEDYATAEGILTPGESPTKLLEPTARARLSNGRIVVASTGNLGFSIGLVARAFGCAAQIHMSRDAKAWKKARLRDIGAEVVEHDGDYAETVARARTAAASDGAYFVDDENSRRLFVGYAAAADELADQLAGAGIFPSADRPLVVYLPCGVGGAPGGITAGLRLRFGTAVVPVFVEPTLAPCFLLALASGDLVSINDLGISGQTIADGLAVPKASPLVLSLIADDVAAAVAVSDADMLTWVERAWRHGGLRLEPSAAAALAALAPLRDALTAAARELPAGTVHVAWLTGGSLLPDDEFSALLRS